MTADPAGDIALPQTHNEAEGAGALERALRDAMQGEARFTDHDRLLYSTDASIYQVLPVGAAAPADIDDAIAAARVCAERAVPILPRGGGTSLAGQCVNRAVVIDFSPWCTRVGEVDEARRLVHVEPGVILDELNETIATRGGALFFAPDVATAKHATIGGMIGNNSAGARSVLYGHTCDHVQAIDALLLPASGGVERVRFEPLRDARHPRARELTRALINIVRSRERLIRERFPTSPRKVSGFSLDRILAQLDEGGEDAVNLATLLCGSEGALALTLGATLRLTPAPVARSLGVAAFSSLEAALEAVPVALSTKPSAVELLDDTVLELARKNREQGRNVPVFPHLADGADPAAVLLIEHSAHADAAELDERERAVREALPGAPLRRLSHADAARAWAVRKAAEPLLHAIPGKRKPVTFVEDASAPPQRLLEFVRRFRDIVERRDCRAAFFAHASVGVLHIRPFLDPHDDADLALLRDIAVDVADLAREMGGALSGEHGDGRVRGPLLERYFGRELMQTFREVKALFDPRNLLNPGAIVDPGPIESITTNLRYAPQGAPLTQPAVEPWFDYSEQGGLLGALEACNGSGVCRKRRGGVMCPSFMATLDERHSTRGRGNALRLAFTGQTGADRRDEPVLNDAETLETLSKCLSCKACKSECPSDVDVARLKSEYLAQSRRAGMPTQLRERVFANLRLLQRAGSLAPGLANALANMGLSKRLASALLGVARERDLPRFGRRIWQREPARSNGAQPRVALFVDCFTGFGEADIARDAVAALESVGCEVVVRDVGCCERPAISLGLLERASTRVTKFLPRLARLAQDVDAVLFLEPSCMSAVVDDLQSLRSGADQATRTLVADKARLADDYLAQRLRDAPPATRADEGAARAVLHAHCHQRALWGAQTSAVLLEFLLGEDGVRTLDTTCCGMAGAFGYLREQYELSMRVAEHSLAPAIRSAPAEALIAAPGASCRQQIRDATGREALHPVQIAAKMLAANGRQ